MTLRKRLYRLEVKLGGDRPDPMVVVFRVEPAKGPVRITVAKADLADIRAEAPALLCGFADAIEAKHSPSGFAIIGGGPHGEAANLTRLKGETEAAFMSRVEAETIRIHGRLRAD
jgi:hypothetical protein